MGCDGGSIPKREELVKQKKKPEQKDKEAELACKWLYCALSSERLRQPIVSCQLGRLYNKEAIIEYLLNKKEQKSNSLANHIKSLKDIVELNLTEIKRNEDLNKNCEYSTLSNSTYICPVVGLEMNGKYKFCYLKNCGCVLSERALREIKTNLCLKCNKEFKHEDIILLNRSNEEIEVLRLELEENRNKLKNDKKNKKRKLDDLNEINNSKTKIMPSTSKSILEQNKKISSKTAIKASNSLILSDKSKKNYSIANDPNASDAFKSLFTTHESALNKPKNNCITNYSVH